VTFKISLDSSIIISHLSGDIHKDDVLASIDRLALLKAEIFLPLICYAEISALSCCQRTNGGTQLTSSRE
jgi:predicted nucleic acid-binding protein